MQKRGQLTIFIILGFFMIVIFSLLYFVSSLDTGNSLDAEVSNTIAQTSPTAFVSYMKQCVGSQLEKHVDKILLQGGFIEPPVNSYRQGTDFISYGILDDTFISYQIPKNHSFPLGLYQLSPGGNPLGLLVSDTNTPYFGKNILPKLCEKYGENTINSTNSFSCLPFLYGSSNTIQENLQQLIAPDIQSCLSTSIIKRQYDFNSYGNGEVLVAFTEDSTVVTVNTSIQFADLTTDISQFTFTYPLRIKKLYTAAYLLATNDVQNILYDKVRSPESFCPNCFSGISVEVHDNYLGGGSDLVLLKDISTTLTSSFDSTILSSQTADPYLTVAFLVENRRPYLEKISSINLRADDFSAFPVPPDRRELEFPVIVHDPDEDIVSVATTVISSNPTGNPSFIESFPYNQTVEVGCNANALCQFTGTVSEISDPSKYSQTEYRVRIEASDSDQNDFQEFLVTIRP